MGALNLKFSREKNTHFIKWQSLAPRAVYPSAVSANLADYQRGSWSALGCHFWSLESPSLTNHHYPGRNSLRPERGSLSCLSQLDPWISIHQVHWVFWGWLTIGSRPILHNWHSGQYGVLPLHLSWFQEDIFWSRILFWSVSKPLKVKFL